MIEDASFTTGSGESYNHNVYSSNLTPPSDDQNTVMIPSNVNLKGAVHGSPSNLQGLLSKFHLSN